MSATLEMVQVQSPTTNDGASSSFSPYSAPRTNHHRYHRCGRNLAVLLLGLLLTLWWTTKTTTRMSAGTQNNNPMVATGSTTTTFSLTTFNIAGCQPSQEAPSNWNKSIAMRAIVNSLPSTSDILCLQECPWDMDFKQLFPKHQLVGTKASHADHIALLIQNDWKAKRIFLEDVPAIVAEIDVGHQRLLHVASVHLEPFQQGSLVRWDQMEILQALVGGAPLLVAGDTNMRVSEDDVMENDLGYQDAWKQAGSDPSTKFTWDTIDHGDGGFNKYYGENTRQYNARYDRVYYFRGNGSTAWTVPSFALIGDQPVTSKEHFLSDHFGITTTIQLHWK